MKCKSCNEDVDVKMKKALEQNKCPYCGGVILDVGTMQQYLDLHDVLGPVKLTDSEWHDKKIKENVIKLLMEQMQCVRKKNVIVADNIVKLNEKPPVTETVIKPTSETTITPEAAEVRRMRSEIYQEIQTEQYGTGEEMVSDEDLEAARGVVFSESVNEKVVALRAKAAASPVKRISRVDA